jgi:glucan 1,3-beta-glucosidase
MKLMITIFLLVLSVVCIASIAADKQLIRGVNIGGWLLAERFITPYLFALNSCQLQGDWCFYPNQLSAPPTGSRKHKYCDLYSCKPHLIETPMEDITKDYPTDEKTLLSSFPTKATAKEYMMFHWDNFVTKDDIIFLSEVAKVEYVRVPLPHYVMNDILDDEPWVDGQWLYFVRFVGWCRQYNINVWIDMHTTFGSQDGFEVTGESLPEAPECQHWITSPENVKRSLDAIKDISQAIMDDNLRDVVTGFGILNSPFANCPQAQIEKYSNDAFKIVRDIMGDNTAVYMTDSFNAANWNNGWWDDSNLHNNTYIDSHYYHVFNQNERALSPKQHIAYTCAKLAKETSSCCYEDHPTNTKASNGVSRIVGEWSAAYDILPKEMVKEIMKEIQDPKMQKAPSMMDRTLSEERKEFLEHHVQAQMVSYESVDTGVSSGWFFYTLKMEGGAFAEWDFSRGIKEGWIPKIPDKNTNSASLFGSCQSIAAKTNDNMNIVKQFPDPTKVKTRLGPTIDDDYVVSHAGGGNTGGSSTTTTNTHNTQKSEPLEIPTTNNTLKKEKSRSFHWFRFFALVFFGYGIWHVFLKDQYGFGRQRGEYNALRQLNF